MQHTPALNVWNGTNRVTALWEELLAVRVSPDPCPGEKFSPGKHLENATDAWSEQDQVSEPTLLEKAGFESLRRIKQALDILSASPEHDDAVEASWEPDLHPLTVSRVNLEATETDGFLRAGSTPGMTFVKVSSDPEPQPASAIDTRRMVYGLKIPLKPLHKRPIYQRIFFSLRHMIARERSEASPGGYK